MKKCWSILTDDMAHCYITGMEPAAVHHIFNGSRKESSEKYGFLVPLYPTLHTYSPDSVHMAPNRGLDLELKQKCQRYFEEYHGTRKEFIDIFGRSYL